MVECREKTIFETASNKKILQKLRGKLQTRNMKLRVSYKIYDYNDEHEMELKVKQENGLKETFVYLRLLTPNVMEMKYGYTNLVLDSNLMLSFALEIARNNNFAVLLATEKKGVQIEHPNAKAFKDNEHELFFSSYTVGDKFFYINIVKIM